MRAAGSDFLSPSAVEDKLRGSSERGGNDLEKDLSPKGEHQALQSW